ncbi:ABC transporter permease subunit, partial [Falsigemmobacter intermedius]
AGLAGGLVSPIRGVEPFMGVEALSIAFVVVVIGGMGSYVGALVAGILVGVVQSLMATIWPEGARLMIYIGMASIIVMMPRGLFGRA